MAEYRPYKSVMVSDDGEVIGLRGRRLKQTLVKGYPCVNIYFEQMCKLECVHKIVAIAWVPNPMEYEQVTHLDGDKTNNKANNLAWVPKRGSCGVVKMKDGNIVQTYLSVRDCAQKENLSITQIYHYLAGKSPKKSEYTYERT